MSISEAEKELEYSRIVHKEHLIGLVESRPVLWDKELDIYKDKLAKATAWREICTILMDNYDEMDSRDQHGFGRYVIKKWSQTRDAWLRTLKEEKKLRKYHKVPSKPYRYHDQMLFLKRVVLTGDPNEGPSSPTRITIEQNRTIAINARVAADRKEKAKDNPEPKKRKTSEDDAIKSLKEFQSAKTATQTEDRNLTFFKSLLPSLALLDDDQTLEFHSGVLSLLQKIKRRPPYYNVRQWGQQSQGYFPIEDLCQSPSATSVSAQSQCSEVPEQPLMKVEMEMESDTIM